MDAADRLRGRTRFAWLLSGALLAALLLLGLVLRVDGAVIGSGEVTVDTNVKTLIHASGGVVAEVLVRDGDHVDANQPLLRLDTSVSDVGSSSASAGLAGLLARRARLEAERDGAPAMRIPADAPRDPETQAAFARERRLFDLRLTEHRGAFALLSERVRQLEDQIRGHEAQIAAIDDQMKLVGPELENLRSLYARKLVTVTRMNELERTAVQLRGSRAALVSTIAETRARIAETREQMLGVDKTRRSDAGTELAEVNARIGEQQVRAAAAADAVTRSVIRSPQSGTVDKLAYTAIGSAVPPGQPILQIVPDRDPLVIEARVRPQDVDQLQLGQAARVTFSGLDRQSTPDIAGKLSFISPDLSRDQQTGATFYRIRIELDAAQLKASRNVVLKAGMPAEAFVRTGSRSILSYLFKPLMDQLRHAFREG